ncbi:MAG: FAD-dependent oxidoreductase, partial [Acidobacteria bacterium]|nr:FAD-dependent oxidoreductase [Acidobacteriota bacterium]
MPSVLIIGGGLAGLSAAAALAGSGFRVDLYEARPFVGGRATSYPLENELIDNCQHVLLRCCVNLLDFYQRLGVGDSVRFHRAFYFIEPGGRVTILRANRLPAPWHLAGSFLGMKCLGVRDKFAIARALRDLRRERGSRPDLDRLSMGAWLREKRQTLRAIQRFWSPVLISAVNEDLDRIAAVHGFQVFWLAFLARSGAGEMGVPSVPLADLYRPEALARAGEMSIHLRRPVERIEIASGLACGVRVNGATAQADYYVSALPFERLEIVAPELGIGKTRFEHSPITSIHLWFDREITRLPHAALLDRNIQWMFNKSRGRYLQLVVSASRAAAGMSRQQLVALAHAELTGFFPASSQAKLEKAHVIKELRATFSAAPGTEAL